MRQATATQGKKDLKKDVISCQKKQRGKLLLQANNLSTKALLNQGTYEMKKKLFDQAVENFSLVIEENSDSDKALILRSKCLT